MEILARRHHHGFTLIELVVVLVIIGILAIYPLFSWQGAAINLDGQAHQIANDIRYTQALSMSKADRYRFVKTSANTYQITNSSGTAIAFPSGNTSITLGTGIAFGTLTNLPNSLIAFDGEGVPYVNTSFPGTALAATATLSLVAGGETKTIAISPITGSVLIQ